MRNSTSTTAPAGQRINAFLAVACLSLAIALPAFAVYGLSTTPAATWLTRLGVESSFPAGQPGIQIALWQSGLAVLIDMLAVCAMAYGLLRARLCLLGFVRGEAFSFDTVRHLRGLAIGMFASALARLLSPPLISVLLTLGAPAGHRSLTLGLGSSEVLMPLFSGIVWQIAHVMTRAVELADEHALIV